jgi:glyoxylase-like metal-dependent hydrolase (beta-lactamase superfamily II)
MRNVPSDERPREVSVRRSSIVMLTACLLFATFTAAAGDSELSFRVRRLTDRVLVFTENSPWEINHVVIVGKDGLVLVDPGHTPLISRLIRHAVAEELGRDRFDYVIDTHGHWGHTLGNAGYPEALVIGHELATPAIEGEAVNIERRVEFLQRQIVQIDARLADLDPASEEAATARLQRDHFDRIVRGLSEPGFAIRAPQLTFSDRLRLDLGDLTLEMRYLGRGHSDSDIVVLIPEEKILLMGCFFLEQGALPVFGNQPVLDPDRWLEVLDEVLDPQIGVEYVVLGQHTVWPPERLAAMRDYIFRLWSEIKALDAEGVDFETAMARIPVPAELDFIREAGATEEDLARYHQTEVAALWRQLQESAAAAIELAINDGGAEAGVARYRDMVEANSSDVYFDENEFNLLGYRLLGQDRVDAAISVFELNVERYPDSWNVYDSLGEACAVKGDTKRAIELYRRSVELNPNNINGVQAIERMGGEVPAAPDNI